MEAKQQQLMDFSFLIISNISSDALCDALSISFEKQKARKHCIYQHFRAFLQQGMRESKARSFSLIPQNIQYLSLFQQQDAPHPGDDFLMI